MIKQGTTPTLLVRPSNIDIAQIDRAIFTFNNKVVQKFYPSENISYDQEKAYFKVLLSQEDTLSLKIGRNLLEVQFISNNATFKSQMYELYVEDTLATEFIDNYTFSNYDDNYIVELIVDDTIEVVDNYYHDVLSHRDYPNQHPISAITGLEAELAEIESEFEDIINDIDSANEKLDELDTDIVSLNNNLTVETQNREAQDTYLSQLIQVISNNLSLLNDNLTTIQSELNLEHEHINSLDTTYNALNLTVQALSQQVETNTSDIALVDVKAQKGEILVDSFVQKYYTNTNVQVSTSPVLISLNDNTAIDNEYFNVGANGTNLLCKKKGISVIEGITNLTSSLGNNVSIIYTCFKNGVQVGGTQSFLARTNLFWKFYVEHNANDIITVKVAISAGNATLQMAPNGASRTFQTIKLI